VNDVIPLGEIFIREVEYIIRALIGVAMSMEINFQKSTISFNGLNERLKIAITQVPLF
jgi:hypothetical protein